MTSGGVLVLLFLLGCGALSLATLVTAARGGRGPADPPVSHPRPASTWPAPRGIVHRRGPRESPAAPPRTLPTAVPFGSAVAAPR